ncbi:hypothetical protein WMY93_034350, partial [Mugilogobius chulae]
YNPSVDNLNGGLWLEKPEWEECDRKPILGREAFESEPASSSMTSECQKARDASVLMHCDLSPDWEVHQRRERYCPIYPRPIGDDARSNTPLFVHSCDKLKKHTIRVFIKTNKDLSEFVQRCHNRYHVFNNETEDETQVVRAFE